MAATAPNQQETQPFDFRHSSLLSERQTRALRQRHEELARALADRITLWLRADFALRLARVEAVSYAGFIGSLSELTHLTLFKLEPMRGVCLLETPPPLVVGVVERLLGGPVLPLSEARELTEVEMALFDQWAQIFFEEWQRLFPEPPAPKAHILGHESAPRFLQSAPPDTMFIEVVFEATFAEQNVPIQIAFPYATLEPLVQNLALPDAPTPTSSAPQTPAVPWNNVLDDMKLGLVAQWIGLEMPARKLAELKAGDFLPLSPELASKVLVRLAGKPKFTARLGTADSHWAVEITGPAPAK